MPSPAFFRGLGLFVLSDFFDCAFRTEVRQEILTASEDKATIVRDGKEGILDESSRRVLSANVAKQTSRLVKDRLLAIKPALEEHFSVTLNGCEAPCFLKYGEGAFYTPHRDGGPNSHESTRKRCVSVVIFLNGRSSEPALGCFGGGSLTFYGLMGGPEWEKCAFPLDPEPGLLVAFRSDILHEVQPVTFGQRLSVVSWFFSEEAPNQ